MRLFLLFLVFIPIGIFAQPDHNFMEENDLWMEDRFEDESNINKEMFDRIIDLGLEIYNPIASKNSERLNITKKWDDSTVNANCSRFWGSVTINMYGGLARRPEISPEAFILVLCHELGHAYGGEPYLQSWRKMSAEGQADYYGAHECAKKIFEKIQLEFYVFEPTNYMNESCNNYERDKEICLRGLTAGQSLGSLLAYMKKEDVPNYETPDPTETDKTLLSYPKTVQCRLDTYFNGTMDLDRPACWYKK